MMYVVASSFSAVTRKITALTVVIARAAPQVVWMLPGLWQVIFAIGVFASCRTLPRPMFVAGAWYLATGLANLMVGSGANALSPLAMAVPYGVGQLYIAAVLYRSGERDAD